MRLPNRIRRKLLRNVQQLTAKPVDSDTVEDIFIQLRDFAKDRAVFCELAHFVAHPSRDRGKTRDSLSRFFRRTAAILTFQFGEQRPLPPKGFPFARLQLRSAFATPGWAPCRPAASTPRAVTAIGRAPAWPQRWSPAASPRCWIATLSTGNHPRR